MSKKLIEKFYSDLSGKEIRSDSATVSFAFEGTAYEIDLTEAEKEDFRKAVSKYVDVARRGATTSSARRTTTSGADPKVVRAWAAENKLDVPARGRLPKSVLEAYEKRSG